MPAERYYTLTEVAKRLNVTPTTIKRWYAWYENDDFAKPYGVFLPPYGRIRNGVKTFTPEAIKDLRKFRHMIRTKYRGCMADFNAYWQWGLYGRTVKSRRDIDEQKKRNQHTVN